MRRAMVAAVAVCSALAACGIGGSVYERKDDIEAMARGLGEAVGTEELNPSAHHRRTAPGCAARLGLPEDEAWYERRSFSLRASGGDVGGFYAALVDHLAAEGYEVTELALPSVGSPAIRAVREDVGVWVQLAGDGANIRITAGPCAVLLTPVPERYDVVEGS